MKSFRTIACALGGLTLVVAGVEAAAIDPCCLPPVEICPPVVVPAPPVASAPCMVPTVVMEKQKQTVTRYRRETRERLVWVSRQVPEKRTVKEDYTVMVPEQRTRTVEVVVGRPVEQSLELRTTTMMPYTEARQTTRTVCRMVPVEEERTVCEVIYHCDGERPPAVRPAAMETRPRNLIRTVAYAPDANGEPPAAVNSPRDPNEPPAPPPVLPPAGNEPPRGVPCDSRGTIACDPCTPSCCVPQVVRRNVRVTCLRPVSQQETVEYPVTRFEPNVKTQQISYNVHEPQTEYREEQYTVDVPQKKTRTREVTVMRTVPVQQKEQYQEMVPYQEQIEVSVPRLRWVPQTVTPPPAPLPCGGC